MNFTKKFSKPHFKSLQETQNFMFSNDSYFNL